jgi:hypothetical protein
MASNDFRTVACGTPRVYTQKKSRRDGIISRPLKSNMIQCSQYFTLIKAIKNLQEKETI